MTQYIDASLGHYHCQQSVKDQFTKA